MVTACVIKYLGSYLSAPPSTAQGFHFLGGCWSSSHHILDLNNQGGVEECGEKGTLLAFEDTLRTPHIIYIYILLAG